MMKGFLYICDEISGNIKDQIGMIDRVLEHGDNVFNLRGRSFLTSGLSNAIQKIRDNGTELIEWSKRNESTTIIIALGYQESRGGGSRRWFELQYKAMIQELKSIGFDSIVCIIPTIANSKGLKAESKRWSNISSGIVDRVSRSLKVESMNFELELYDSKKILPSIDSLSNLSLEITSVVYGTKRKRIKIVKDIPNQSQASPILPPSRKPKKTPFDGALNIRKKASRITKRAKRQREAVSEIPQAVTPIKEEKVEIPPLKVVKRDDITKEKRKPKNKRRIFIA